MAEAKRVYTEVSECDVTVQWVYNCVGERVPATFILRMHFTASHMLQLASEFIAFITLVLFILTCIWFKSNVHF